MSSTLPVLILVLAPRVRGGHLSGSIEKRELMGLEYK